MLDAALIKECADPSLKPAIVERFVVSAGSADPLAVTVKSGGRLILVPKAASADEAMVIVRQYAGQAVVRVGLTQFPAGVGVKEASDLKPDLVDACQNLRKGTAMFAKVLRIVAKWYGNPTSKDVFPQIFEDAVYAWKTGEFEGVSVFQAEDPGTAVEVPQQSEEKIPDEEESAEPKPGEQEPETVQDVGRAGMRIDLSHIGGQK
ncbi:MULTISPECIES: TraH family protein [Rhizobium/Agrobacterium group]|uniref:Conjugal transfer protein TraH n=4 Tax=Rhizobium/Agrobacterium group TaxID=227290 RepID=A8W0A1_RHIRH|nr:MULTISPECIES: TraH family protein [Rhizobium/Agrobacterium group]ABW33637.1 rcorf80 [Rhizobium rhizogenes]AQS65453.1 conjugal transfer protein TraH [Rhizobium rhizogenes]ASK42134.1 conjugal transfer protein TraH [Rhizobium rhizogenes]MCZ7445621.1 TraH family protein [Rhizobium rhizogenes]MCZ7472549.1 TraH family protein [Rhizobium rhizogenes]